MPNRLDFWYHVLATRYQKPLAIREVFLWMYHPRLRLALSKIHHDSSMLQEVKDVS